jgi:hypothetical protein
MLPEHFGKLSTPLVEGSVLSWFRQAQPTVGEMLPELVEGCIKLRQSKRCNEFIEVGA